MAKVKRIRFRSFLAAFGILILAALWIWHLRAIPDAHGVVASSDGNPVNKEENIESLAMLLKDSRSAVTGSSNADKRKSESASSSLDWQTGGDGSARDLCMDLAKDYGIVPGKTWGKLDGKVNLQRTWTNYRCNLELKGIHSVPTPKQVSETFAAATRKSDNIDPSVKSVKQEPAALMSRTSQAQDLSKTEAEKARYEKSIKWCNAMQKLYKVKPGSSWGGLQKKAELRAKWNEKECDVVMRGAFMSCEERNGWDLVKHWRNASQHVNVCPKGQEQQKRSVCRRSREGNFQCSMYDLALDFGKVSKLQEFKDNPKLNVGATWGTVESRSFGDGFARLPCRPLTRNGRISREAPQLVKVSADLDTQFRNFLPGFDMIQTRDTLQDIAAMKRRTLQLEAILDDEEKKEKEKEEPRLKCEINVAEPVLVVSHDSTTNFGHLVQDMMNWWLAAEVAGLDRNKVAVLSIDGLRPATIHNGRGRILMNVTHPDDLGPFSELIDKVLFKRSINPLDAGWAGKIVCFAEVHFFPFPLKPFLWGKFEVTDQCSSSKMRADKTHTPRPSTLYARFRNDYQSEWRKLLGPQMTSIAAKQAPDRLRVLFMTRRPDPQKRLEFMARHLVNEEEVISALQKSLKATHEVVPVDFSTISFRQQVLTAFEADILLGFHGAGSNHIFHMNNKRARCCGLIEVFPQRKDCDGDKEGNVCAMAQREGHGNHARYLGFEYDMIVAADNSFTRPLTPTKESTRGSLRAGAGPAQNGVKPVGTYIEPSRFVHAVQLMTGRIRGDDETTLQHLYYPRERL